MRKLNSQFGWQEGSARAAIWRVRDSFSWLLERGARDASAARRGKGVKSGSALLITLLMLGVLMTLVLGISTLVIREIGVTQSIVDANKAYYSAEAGVENALLDLSQHKPGYEPKDGSVKFPADKDAYDANFSYEYDISNQSDTVPGLVIYQ